MEVPIAIPCWYDKGEYHQNEVHLLVFVPCVDLIHEICNTASNPRSHIVVVIGCFIGTLATSLIN